MILVKTVFTNELGHEIEMTVLVDEIGVTVRAKGPTSIVEHTWTPAEAKVLSDLLGMVEPAYKTS